MVGATSVVAQSMVTLAWDDPNPPGTVAQYEVAWGLGARTYGTNALFTTNMTARVPVKVGWTNFFAVRARSGGGLESDWSPELAYPAPLAPPTNLVISVNLQASMTVTGTWQSLASFSFPVNPAINPQNFFRSSVNITNP